MPHHKIDVASHCGGNAGNIILATDDTQNHLNIFLDQRGKTGRARGTSGYLTLSPEVAEKLRDALLELYPAPPVVAAPRYVTEPQLNGDGRVDIFHEVIGPIRTLTAVALNQDVADTIVTALTKKEAV